MSTRESADIRRETFALGVSQISAGSRTNPGGYTSETFAHEAVDARFGPQPAIGTTTLHRDGRALDAGLIAFQTVDDRQHAFYFQPDRLAVFDSFKARATRGHHVFDDNHFLTLVIRSLDKLLGAVAFRFFTDHDAPQRFRLLSGDHQHRGGDRIGTQGHTAHQFGHIALDKIQHARADKWQRLGLQRDLPAIKVKTGLLA